jgi:hypothetical protein
VVLGAFYAIKKGPACPTRIGITYEPNENVNPIMDVINNGIDTELVPKFLCANKDTSNVDLNVTGTTSCSLFFANIKKESNGVPEETFTKFQTAMTPILCKVDTVNQEAIKKLPGDIIKAVCK